MIAHRDGEYGVEAGALKARLALGPKDEPTYQWAGIYLSIAEQNDKSTTNYKMAQVSLDDGDLRDASDKLQAVWGKAPYYRDPAGIAPRLGLNVPPSYEEHTELSAARNKTSSCQRELEVTESEASFVVAALRNYHPEIPIHYVSDDDLNDAIARISDCDWRQTEQSWRRKRLWRRSWVTSLVPLIFLLLELLPPLWVLLLFAILPAVVIGLVVGLVTQWLKLGSIGWSEVRRDSGRDTTSEAGCITIALACAACAVIIVLYKHPLISFVTSIQIELASWVAPLVLLWVCLATWFVILFLDVRRKSRSIQKERSAAHTLFQKRYALFQKRVADQYQRVADQYRATLSDIIDRYTPSDADVELGYGVALAGIKQRYSVLENETG